MTSKTKHRHHTKHGRSSSRQQHPSYLVIQVPQFQPSSYSVSSAPPVPASEFRGGTSLNNMLSSAGARLTNLSLGSYASSGGSAHSGGKPYPAPITAYPTLPIGSHQPYQSTFPQSSQPSLHPSTYQQPARALSDNVHLPRHEGHQSKTSDSRSVHHPKELENPGRRRAVSHAPPAVPLRGILRNKSSSNSIHQAPRPSERIVTSLPVEADTDRRPSFDNVHSAHSGSFIGERSSDGHRRPRTRSHYPPIPAPVHGTPYPRTRSLDLATPPIIDELSSTPNEEPIFMPSSERRRGVSIPRQERAYPDIPRNMGQDAVFRLATERCQCLYILEDYAQRRPHLANIAHRMKRAGDSLELHRNPDGVIEIRRLNNGRLRTDLLEFVEHIDVLAGDAVEKDKEFAYQMPYQMMFDVLNLFRTPADLEWIAEIITRRKEMSGVGSRKSGLQNESIAATATVTSRMVPTRDGGMRRADFAPVPEVIRE